MRAEDKCKGSGKKSENDVCPACGHRVGLTAKQTIRVHRKDWRS